MIFSSFESLKLRNCNLNLSFIPPKKKRSRRERGEKCFFAV